MTLNTSPEASTASLFSVVVQARQQGVEAALRQLINEASGRTFGARVLNWAIGKLDADTTNDLKTAWADVHPQMASTLDMLMQEPNPPTTEAQIVEWISAHGGMRELHTQAMAQYRAMTPQQRRKAKRS